MRIYPLLVGALLITACGGGGQEQSRGTPDAADSQEETVSAAIPPSDTINVDLATRRVSCGCAVEGIGVCGNYIEIDGVFVKIANSKELGLGGMEWCGKDGVTAESSGEIRDGKFFATRLIAHSDG
jgi:hypothetical protein